MHKLLSASHLIAVEFMDLECLRGICKAKMRVISHVHPQQGMTQTAVV